MMHKRIKFLAVLGFIFLMTGCAENQTRIGEGAGLGGLLGATVGGIAGHQSGNDATGILVGGAVGAATGAIIGSQIDKPVSAQPVTRTVYVQPVPQPVTGPLTIQQVVELTRQGIPSDEIVHKIQTSNPKYYLTMDDIDYMRRQGVSQRVIETMQAYR